MHATTHAFPPILLLALLASSTVAQAVDDPTSYVDPLIGTASGGNTFPGAVVPWGMVAWSPETTRGDATRRPAPGGYQYNATRVRGFSLTHLSGTGCRGASGEVPFMPLTRGVDGSPSADTTDRRYATSFSHANETAEPGYYRVRLRHGVNVELTASSRTGTGRFTYPVGSPAVMLVRTSDSEVGSGDARVEVDAASRTVTGSVTSGNFCGYIHEISRRDYYTLHFVAVFDRPFRSVGTWQDDDVFPDSTRARGGTGYGPRGVPEGGRGSGAWVVFDTTGVPVNVRVGISYVSLENARRNLEAENGAGTSFEEVRSRARAWWRKELARVRVSGGTEEQRTVFYTALYHVLLHPNVFSDVNGEYMGFDGVVHDVGAGRSAQYANFSGWDVYRSQVQLLALLRPDVASDVAASLLSQATQYGGVWDRWTHNNGATHVMEGDASALAVAGIVAFGGDAFDEAGAAALLERSGNWTNVFNPETGYIQDRYADGRWREPFDPSSGRGFAEGSSAQYTWMVPFDARGLFDLMGGDARAVERLDAFFHTDDGAWALTGLGGLHAEMDNEPSVGTPWLYMFAGRPDKTQETLRAVLTTLWDDTPHGIPGNDDLGAMSSWYVFTAMGLYPYYPGRAELLLSAPLFPRVELRRSNGVTLTVVAPGAAADVPYIHGVTVDGRPHDRIWLPEGFVARGGEVGLVLEAVPGRWGEPPPSFGR